MSYEVYTAEYIGFPNHCAIFVETIPEEEGILFHVTGGNARSSMKYEKKRGKHPTASISFIPGSMIRFGTLKITDLASFESACEAVAVPGAQLNDQQTSKDSSKTERRCGDWVQDVKDKVIAEKIVQE